jgi:hypothetical protein
MRLAVYTCAWAGTRDPGPALALQCEQIQVQTYTFATFFTNIPEGIIATFQISVNGAGEPAKASAPLQAFKEVLQSSILLSSG